MTLRTYVRAQIPPALVRRLRESRNWLRRYRDKFLAVDRSVFERSLRDLGIVEGDVVYVRSSYNDMGTIRANPFELVMSLCNLVGEQGTIVMPTYPTNGLTLPYLKANRSFHWRRTPSRSGLLTEVFRRLPDARRSLHPTHSVAARGRLADELTSGHEESGTPFDEHSPYFKLLQHDTKLLSIGRFDSLPMRHLADHLIQDLIPYPIYCEEHVSVHLVGKERELDRPMRTHNPSIRCNHEVVLREMQKEEQVSRAQAGRVPMMLVRLENYIEAYRRCFSRGLLRYVWIEAQPATSGPR